VSELGWLGLRLAGWLLGCTLLVAFTGFHAYAHTVTQSHSHTSTQVCAISGFRDFGFRLFTFHSRHILLLCISLMNNCYCRRGTTLQTLRRPNPDDNQQQAHRRTAHQNQQQHSLTLCGTPQASAQRPACIAHPNDNALHDTHSFKYCE
jgi:hypothetical protein